MFLTLMSLSLSSSVRGFSFKMQMSLYGHHIDYVLKKRRRFSCGRLFQTSVGLLKGKEMLCFYVSMLWVQNQRASLLALVVKRL